MTSFLNVNEYNLCWCFFPDNVKLKKSLYIISLIGAINITTTIPGIVYPVPRFVFEYYRFAGT